MFQRTALVVVLSSLGALAAHAADPTVDMVLRESARELNTRLVDKGYKTVGVLPVVLQAGESPQVYHGAPINASLSEWIESALIMYVVSDSAAPDGGLDIIDGAGRVAAKKRGIARYRTVQSRKDLFSIKYPLLYGADQRKADAFLLTKLWHAEDFSKANLSIYVFDSKDLKPERLLSRDVRLDAHLLSSLGQSFMVRKKGQSRTYRLTRGPNDLGDIEIDEQGTGMLLSSDEAESVKLPEDLPVQLTIRYDRKEQDVSPDPFRGAHFSTVPTPREDQRVTFDVKNTSDKVVAIVLTVNGYNTLYREEGAHERMTKWVLQPNKEYHIRGWRLKDTDPRPTAIVGASEEESRRLYDEIGSDRAGLINMWVYEKDSGFESDDESPLASRTYEDLYRLTGAENRFDTKEEYQSSLSQFAQNEPSKKGVLFEPPTKGLLVVGDEVKGKPLKFEEFGPGHLVGHLQIKYYDIVESTRFEDDNE